MTDAKNATTDMYVVLDAESISEDTLRVVGKFLEYTQPTIVVEAGTYKGTFAITAATLSQNAHIYTADAIDHNWRELLARNNVQERVSFVNADFEQIAVQYPAIVGQVDLALIDSGWPMITHESGVRARHFKAAQRWMKPGGSILIDDLRNRDWPGAEEIAAQCCVILPTDRGLGLWRKHV